VFLAFQYPVEIPGVNNVYLLKAGLNAMRKHRGLPELDAYEFLILVREKMKLMHMDESFLNRGVNEGFSGGEKKRNEILQMAVLEPSSRCSTRRIPDSTSTRCAWSRTA
jgi:Fe-S cluster assembly ATP-binding protein